MQHKGTKHGKGSARRAVRYLLQDHDSKGELRAGVDVLRGDPHAVADLAESLDFKWKYSSSVLGFAVEEDPTLDEINAVLDDIEQIYFAGLERDRVQFCAVMHTGQDGRKDLHLVTACVDLETGKHFNPLPPGHIKWMDHLRDYHNHKNGWARPDDPIRRQLIEKGPEAHRPSTRAEIETLMKEMAAAGLVTNRDDVVNVLKQWGEVTRLGKEYIGVKPEGAKSAIRLRGGIFNDDWTAAGELDREAAHASLRSTGRGGQVDEERAAAVRAEFELAVQRRADENRERYKKPEAEFTRTAERSAVNDRSLEADAGNSAEAGIEQQRSTPDQRTLDEPDQSRAAESDQRSDQTAASSAKQSEPRSPELEQDDREKLAKALADWRRDCDQHISSHNGWNADAGQADKQQSSSVERLAEPDQRSGADAEPLAGGGRVYPGQSWEPLYNSPETGAALHAPGPSVRADRGLNNDRNREAAKRAARTNESVESRRNSGLEAIIDRTSAAIRRFAAVCSGYFEQVREYVEQHIDTSDRSREAEQERAREREQMQQQHSASISELERAVEAVKRQTERVGGSVELTARTLESIEFKQELQRQQQSRGGWEMEM